MASSAGRVLIIPKGEWSATENYSLLDAVYDNGSSYIAKKAVLANAVHPEHDGEHWQLLAQGYQGGETGGYNILKRATHYETGAVVFSTTAKKWVMLVCITGGTTALSEPADYAAITQQGGTITDGTAVFAVRDLRADNSVAQVTSNGTAPTDLSMGDYIIMSGLLYRVTADVAAGGSLTPGTNVLQVTVMSEVKMSHTQFIHSFTASSFSLVSGGVWDGYYKSNKSVTVHNPSGSVRASGQTLDAPPSDDVKKAVSQMYFEIDDTANTLTAYTKSAPTVTIYVAVEGVQ